MGEEIDNGSEKVTVDRDLVLELNFVPSWARKPPGATQHFYRDASPDQYERRDKRDRHGRRDRHDRRGRAPSSRDTAGRTSGRRGEAARGGPRRGPDQRGPRMGGGDGRPAGRPAEDRRPSPVRSHDRRPRLPPVERPPVEVRFLPEQKRLSAVVRQIASTKRAYPLTEVATLFLTHPESCQVRIQAEDEAKELSFFQCKVCGVASLDHALIERHLVHAHLGDFFEREETLGDPPSGKFVCVARCGMSGELLAPPNHHSYNARISEVHKARYANMPLSAYKSRIETVHDAAMVEQWKEERRKKTEYRLRIKGGERGEPMDRGAAEQMMLQEIGREKIVKSRRVTMSAVVARKMDDRALKLAVQDAWRRESRFPLMLAFALRGAFRHRRLSLFKAGSGKGIRFATAIDPAYLEPAHAIESIREVLLYLHEHPGCTREELRKELRPDAAPGDDAAKEVLSPLGWLIERGHIIEFFDGRLSVPMGVGKRVGSRGGKRVRKTRGRRAGGKKETAVSEKPAATDTDKKKEKPGDEKVEG